MKKILLFFLLLIIIAQVTFAQTKPAAAANAATFLNHLSYNKFDEAAAMFDARVAEKISPQTLKQLWQTLQVQVGVFESGIGNMQVEDTQDHQTVVQTLSFRKQNIDLKLAFDKEGKISGIFFQPSSQQKQAYQLPAYANPEQITEQELVIKSGKYELPATLTLPKSAKGKVPVVVLVHGSGPHDRDETIGPNKPFKDLAYGLANHGIATLRYEKRSKKYGAEMMKETDKLTVKQEVLDDAAAAVELLKGRKDLPLGEVYVLGHSLGGMLAPRLVQQQPKIDGLILMAANARPLEDLVLEQMQYLLSLQGQAPEEQLKQLQKQVDLVKSKNLTPATPTDQLPLGLPAAYWLDLRGYQPAEVAAKLKLPVLVLQGERDYQVTMKDFAIWQEKLKNKKGTSLHAYPKLNHLFQEGEGPATPAEYLQPGNIPAYVIKDIAEWIKTR